MQNVSTIPDLARRTGRPARVVAHVVRQIWPDLPRAGRTLLIPDDISEQAIQAVLRAPYRPRDAFKDAMTQFRAGLKPADTAS